MSVNTHSFNVELASKIGLNDSLILQHLYFWYEKNRLNDRNVIDGKIWTYNSIKAFCGIFPYLTKNQIIGALKRLLEKGIIEEGNFNKISFDKTKWYSITKIGLIDFLKVEMELPKSRNQNSENQKPIPDSNTDSNTDSILTWRTDFETYKKQLTEEYTKLINDHEFIKQQEEFHPNIDIKLSIKKACVNFWATDVGWKFKIKKKSIKIDWVSTLTNAIDKNKVYKGPPNQQNQNTFTPKYQSLENYEREGER